jgi:hypothetical protein
MSRMINRSFVAGVLGVVLLTFVACSSAGESVPVSSPPTSVSSSDHAPDWLAVIAASTDPNDLDARRSEVVAALGTNDPRVVVSPGACFSGIARQYAGGYVLAITDRSHAVVEELLRQTRSDAEWSGPVTSTCID